MSVTILLPPRSRLLACDRPENYKNEIEYVSDKTEALVGDNDDSLAIFGYGKAGWKLTAMLQSGK